MRFVRSLCVALTVTAFPGISAAAEIIANRTLRAGTILAPGDLGSRDSSVAGQASEWVGLEVRRAIYAGHNVLPGDLGPPTLVHRNDIVTMTFSSGGLGLRTEGRALGAGGQGERIEVMNLDSRTVVRARVIGARQVEVGR